MLNRKMRRNNARMMRKALQYATRKGHDFCWIPVKKD